MTCRPTRTRSMLLASPCSKCTRQQQQMAAHATAVPPCGDLLWRQSASGLCDDADSGIMGIAPTPSSSNL